jgi:hypothetical protein
MAMRYYAPFPGGGGDPLRPRGPHALRIGDAERDAAAADLGEHYAAGRLTLDELNQRLDAVFSAKTFGHLAKIMTDLPGPGRLSWRTGPHGPGARPGQWPDNSWGSAGFQEPPASAERTGGMAALSLLLLAMLIWLFTALLFARHGFYHPGPYGPSVPYGHFAHTLQQYNGPQSPVTP